MSEEFSFVTFDRDRGANPCLITVADVSASEVPDHAFMATVDVEYEALDNGLPAHLKQLYKVEDAIVDALSAQGALYFGHVVADGKSRVLMRSTHPVPPSISVKTGLFKRESFSTESWEDRDWSYFNEHFAPTGVERQIGKNVVLLGSLRQQGDNAELERLVDFTFYFPSEAQREAFLAELQPHGYNPNREGRWTSEDGISCVSVDAKTTIVNRVIAQRCAFVDDLATKHGGTFDGWACHVTRE